MALSDYNFPIERSFIPREKMGFVPNEVVSSYPNVSKAELTSALYFNSLSKSAQEADRVFNLKKFLLPFSEVREPSYTAQVKSKAQSRLSGLIANAVPAGLLSLVTFILDNSNEWVVNPTDRRMWVRHFLVITQRESFGRENASNPSGAYGLLQHLKSNWNYHTANFKDSRYCRSLRRRGIFTKLASLVKVHESDLLQPHGYNNPDSMPVMQLAPILGQIAMLKAYVDKCFVFTELGWKPNPRYQTPLCEQVFETYKSVLRHRYAGRQLIVSLGHVSGTSWMFNKIYHPTAYSEDISLFAASLDDPAVDNFISKANRYWAPIFNDRLFPPVIGDPDKDIRVGGKRRDIRYLASDLHTDVPSSGAKVKILSHFNPHRKKIKTKGGQHTHKGHFGLDIDIYYKPVKAMSDSTVFMIGNEPSLTDGRGKYIILKSTDPTSLNWTSRYIHLSDIKVKQGQKVSKGAIIGISGDTGASKSPHLHLEIIDPKGIHRNPLSLDVPLSYVNAV
jgi:hypothetical protein